MSSLRISCALALALALAAAPQASASGRPSPALSPGSSSPVFSWAELPRLLRSLIGSFWEKEGASLDPSGTPKPGGSTAPPPAATASGEEDSLPPDPRAIR
jgi:hypothetical protein